MTAAFVLGINMAVAGIFAVAFTVVAATNRSARGAWWLALGCGVGIVNAGLEFLLRQQADPVPVSIAIFLVFLSALSFALIGVARHYRVEPPWTAMAAVWIVTVLLVPVVFSMTYGSLSRLVLYQLPYFAMQALFGMMIWRSGRRQPLDLLLVVLQAVGATLYLLKPLFAMLVGTARTPQDYMATTYAAISQSGSVVVLIATGLVMLLVTMRDTTAEMIARSETDPLSGVFNRRGFERHAEAALAREGRAALIAADLDHFKQINDSFGHAAGDGVIAHFAAMLTEAAPSEAIVGRVGERSSPCCCLPRCCPTDASMPRRCAPPLRRRNSPCSAPTAVSARPSALPNGCRRRRCPTCSIAPTRRFTGQSRAVGTGSASCWAICRRRRCAAPPDRRRNPPVPSFDAPPHCQAPPFAP